MIDTAQWVALDDVSERTYLSMFIVWGADVNIANAAGRKPIEQVVQADKEHDRLIELLMEHGAELNDKSLLEASSSGCAPLCKALINHGASLDVLSSGGHTPLHLAAMKNRLDVVKELLDRGADVNTGMKPNRIEQQDLDGAPPLFCAVQYSTKDLITLLIDRGPGLSHCTPLGCTVLAYATSRKLDNAVDVLRLLIKAGADVNAGLVKPLAEAAECGNLEAVKLLLRRGADPHAHSRVLGPAPSYKILGSMTAADLARREGREEVAKYLDKKSTG